MFVSSVWASLPEIKRWNGIVSSVRRTPVRDAHPSAEDEPENPDLARSALAALIIVVIKSIRVLGEEIFIRTGTGTGVSS